jgi:hypothetical protein
LIFANQGLMVDSVASYAQFEYDRYMRKTWIIWVILVGFGLWHGPVAAQDSSSVPSSPPNSQTDEQIRAYWTPERMKAARPTPMSVSGPLPVGSFAPPPYAVHGSSEVSTGEDGVTNSQH